MRFYPEKRQIFMKKPPFEATILNFQNLTTPPERETNSRTFELIFKPLVQCIKCRDDLYMIARTWMTQKIILQLFTNLCSIMAVSDSLNIALHCACIFAQSLSNSEINRSCVLIVFHWSMRNQICWTDISEIMAQTWYNAIYCLKHVIYWWNIALSDCALKLVQYGAILE